MLRAGVGLAFRRGRLQHVYNILRGKDLETGDVSKQRRVEQFEKLRAAQVEVVDLTHWHEFLKCLKHAGFLNWRMIASESAVIYTYVLWLTGKCAFGLDLKVLRRVIARWFFMAHTTGRYTSSAETQIEADLRSVANITPGDGRNLCDALDKIVESTFTRDYWEISLPNALYTSNAKSPVLLAYWAALNLLDAEALFSDVKIRDLLDSAGSAPRSVERHHLFPKTHLAAKGFTASWQVNTAANMAFLDWPENATIDGDGPVAYWTAMTKSMTPERLDRQRKWHALPVGWEQLDYQTFLERRRLGIAQVVKDGFNRLLGGKVNGKKPTVNELIDGGESQTVEFKSTARLNLHTGQADKKMEHAVARTVCGFLNADGGKLVVGVDDDRNVVGLDDDIKTLGSKASLDGYELFLRQCLDNSLSIQTAGVVRIRFEKLDGADVCLVSVDASGKEV